MADLSADYASVAREEICHTAPDMVTPGARWVAALLCRKQFEAQGICVLELLHDSDHQRDFLRAGSTVADAIQRVAIAQVQARLKQEEKTVGARVKELFALVDEQHKATAALEEKDGVFSLDQHGLEALAQAAAGSDNPAQGQAYVYRALTRALKECSGWRAKIDRLLEAGKASFRADSAGLPYLDAMIADVLSFRNSVADIFGEYPRPIDFVEDMIALAEGAFPRAGSAEYLSPTAQRLGEVMNAGWLPQAVEMLHAHMRLVLTEPASLTGARDMGEVEIVAQVMQRVKRKEGVLGGRGTLGALERRARSLTHPDMLSEVLQSLEGDYDRLKKVLELYERLPLDDAREALSNYVTTLTQGKWTERVLPDSLGVVKRLRLVGDLYRRIDQAGLPSRQQLSLQEDLRSLEAAILQKTDFFRRMSESRSSPVDKATTLIDLRMAGAFSDQVTQGRADRLIQEWVTMAGFEDAYLHRVGGDKQKLQSLQRRLDRLGIGYRPEHL